MLKEFAVLKVNFGGMQHQKYLRQKVKMSFLIGNVVNWSISMGKKACDIHFKDLSEYQNLFLRWFVKK